MLKSGNNSSFDSSLTNGLACLLFFIHPHTSFHSYDGVFFSLTMDIIQLEHDRLLVETRLYTLRSITLLEKLTLTLNIINFFIDQCCRFYRYFTKSLKFAFIQFLIDLIHCFLMCARLNNLLQPDSFGCLCGIFINFRMTEKS